MTVETPEEKVNSLDDSGDQRSRLWKLTCMILGWISLVLPLAVAADKMSIPQAVDFVEWMVPLVFGMFGGIKLTQKIMGMKKILKGG